MIYFRCQPSMNTIILKLSRQHFLWGHLSISAITQLLLNQLWQNFKYRFLGQSLLDAICQDDICPCTISPGDTCPYHQYLTQFWPKFLEPMFWGSIIFWPTFCWIQIFGIQNYLDPKLSRAQNSSWIQYFLDQRLFWIQNSILTQIIFDKKFFGPTIFPAQNFLKTKFFGHKISLHPNFFGLIRLILSWFNLYNKRNNIIFLGFDSIEINLVLTDY